jgi:2',3'-cyclic-nucleotide 2'-phosphodiesterase (5'-nucleotidase family)
VQQINTKNIPVNRQTSTIDPQLQAMVKPYSDSIAHDMSTLLAVSAGPLVKDKPESKLTNLVADILLEFGQRYCQKKHLNIKLDVSYVNYGGLRASLPQGEITVGHIFELMPFENKIVLIRIPGESIRKMAEKIAVRGGEGVAGLKLGIRDNKPVTLKIGGKDVDPAASYWLVTNDYVANGGDQMNMFTAPFEKIETKMKIRNLLIHSISDRYKKSGTLDVKEDGRIYHEQ